MALDRTGSVRAVPRPRTPAGRARVVEQRLAERFPGTANELCALTHKDPFQLLVATILSAQCTDERVNMTTPALFARYPDAEALAAADPEEVEELIRPTGFFRSKTRNLIGMATGLVERFGGEVPKAMEDLVTLPGVGRKTANVVRSVDFDLPGLPVDTHVQRLAKRLGLSTATDPVAMEAELGKLVPPDRQGTFSLRLILHGRATCRARVPHCSRCMLADICPSAGIGDLKRSRHPSSLSGPKVSRTRRRHPKVPSRERIGRRIPMAALDGTSWREPVPELLDHHVFDNISSHRPQFRQQAGIM